MASSAPSHYRALTLASIGAAFSIVTKPTPQADTGSVVVRVLSVCILSYQREIYDNTRPYPLPLPLVDGNSAIARILSVGPDATALEPGDLVWANNVIRARDDRGAMYLCGIHEGMNAASRKLSHHVWRDSTFAQVAKMPLENCVKLDERRLCGELGYSVAQLAYLLYLLVPFGGLRDIRVEPGERVVVCPATGGFGGAAVFVAAAMGARVVAMGRNQGELARLREFVAKGLGMGVDTVTITGDEGVDTDALGVVDAVFDISPPVAAKGTHLRSAVRALRKGGRISEMGSVEQPIVDWKFMGNDLTLKGKLMYESDDMLLFVKMIERGLFPAGEGLAVPKEFRLEEWKQAFVEAALYTGVGRLVVLNP